MIKFGDKKFLLADKNGDSVPFSAADLQGELINCFLSAGMRDSSCFAEDVALAIEYALEENSLNGNTVGEDELNALVVDTLEKSGFLSVAEWFCRRNGRKVEVLFNTNFEGISEVAAKRGMLLNGEDGAAVLRRCADAFRAADIRSCPAGLIVEMLRYYNNTDKNNDGIPAENHKAPKCDYLIKIAELYPQFSDSLSDLFRHGILKINDVTVYHPSIRIYIDFAAYAEARGLQPVLTEMLWMPYALELGQNIDAAVELLQRKYVENNAGKDLPIYLTVNNMGAFAAKYFGTDGSSDKKLAAYLIESLQNNMVNYFYKVRF